MDTKETLPITEENFNMLYKNSKLRKQVESLKETMPVRLDMLTLAKGKVAIL